METVTIHESKNSEKVVKFIDLDCFTDEFIKAYNNATIYGVYYNDRNEVVAMDIWNKEHKNIMK